MAQDQALCKMKEDLKQAKLEQDVLVAINNKLQEFKNKKKLILSCNMPQKISKLSALELEEQKYFTNLPDILISCLDISYDKVD